MIAVIVDDNETPGGNGDPSQILKFGHDRVVQLKLSGLPIGV